MFVPDADADLISPEGESSIAVRLRALRFWTLSMLAARQRINESAVGGDVILPDNKSGKGVL
jgi:hypothetical protein